MNLTVLDELNGWQHTLLFPGLGELTVGPYRLVNVMMAIIPGGALFGRRKMRRHWIQHRGPRNYVAPF